MTALALNGIAELVKLQSEAIAAAEER
jgi:hypothetical protein